MTKDIVVPKGLHRLSKQHAPSVVQQQFYEGNLGVQIGQTHGPVTVQHTVNHIGSQVNHIRNGKLVASLEEEAHPSSWPELIRASVWGGL